MSLEDTLQIVSLKSSSFHVVYLAFLSIASKFPNPVRESSEGYRNLVTEKRRPAWLAGLGAYSLPKVCQLTSVGPTLSSHGACSYSPMLGKFPVFSQGEFS